MGLWEGRKGKGKGKKRKKGGRKGRGEGCVMAFGGMDAPESINQSVFNLYITPNKAAAAI